MWKNTKLGIYVLSSRTRVFSVRRCGWHQNGWNEAEYGSHVEETDEKRWSWGTNIISWRILGMYSTWMQTKWNSYLDNLRRCWNHVFLLEQLENYRRHGRTYSKMRWAILSIGKARRQSSYTKSSLVWIIINSSRKNSNQLENWQTFAHKWSCNVCTWHE